MRIEQESAMISLQQGLEKNIRRVVSEEFARESLKRDLSTRRNSETDIPSSEKKCKRVRIQIEPLQMVEPDALPLNHDYWYSKEDLARSRQLARKLSRTVNPDPVLMETYYTQHKADAVKLLKHSNDFWKQRGLERLSSQHSVCRNIQVCSVKSAVLLEQSSQFLDGVQDPDRLASASRMASGPSAHFAQTLAIADQAMADRIHAETAQAKTATTTAVTAKRPA